MRGPSRADAVHGALVGKPRGTLSVTCPRCEAPIGWRCYTFIGGKQGFRKKVHPERTKAAKRALDEIVRGFWAAG